MTDKYADDYKVFRDAERAKNPPFTDWLVGDQQAESLACLEFYKDRMAEMISLSSDPEAALAVWRRMEEYEGARPGEAGLRRFKSLLIARELLDRKVALGVETLFTHPDVAKAVQEANDDLVALRTRRDELIHTASDRDQARQIYNRDSDNPLTWERLAKFAHDLEVAGLLPGGEKMLDVHYQNKMMPGGRENK